MRSMTLGLVFGTLLVFAAQGFARGDEGEAKEAASVKPATVKALRQRVDALEAQIHYLRSREVALTRYVLGNEVRAAGIMQVVRQARVEGFEARSIPVSSRKTLLSGMESMAASLRSDLPEISRAEEGMLKAIKKAEAAAR
jgi:hypothetical protein